MIVGFSPQKDVSVTAISLQEWFWDTGNTQWTLETAHIRTQAKFTEKARKNIDPDFQVQSTFWYPIITIVQ